MRVWDKSAELAMADAQRIASVRYLSINAPTHPYLPSAKFTAKRYCLPQLVEIGADKAKFKWSAKTEIFTAYRWRLKLAANLVWTA